MLVFIVTPARSDIVLSDMAIPGARRKLTPDELAGLDIGQLRGRRMPLTRFESFRHHLEKSAEKLQYFASRQRPGDFSNDRRALMAVAALGVVLAPSSGFT